MAGPRRPLGDGAMRPAWLISLRVRLIAGAGAIALVAIFAALLAAYGSAETARRIDDSMAAQARLDLLAGLSGRVSDYAILAVESASSNMPVEARKTYLEFQAGRVERSFARIDEALSEAVAAAEGADEETRMLLATRGLTLARMQAQFATLRRNVEESYDAENALALRPALDSFATRFSPLLNEAVEEERRVRQAATASVRELRTLMKDVAIAAAIAAPLMLLAFAFWLVRPLLARLAQVSRAATDIGRGALDVKLPLSQRDELGLLYAKINQMAARLTRRRQTVDADRARLNEVIEERTLDLSAANARLSEADAERRRFFADIGHELRTPLTVILAESDLLLNAAVISESDARGGLKVIQARARRLNRRIDDLLRVARSETGQIELDTQPFDLVACLQDAMEDMAPGTKRRRLVLQTALEEGLWAKGDRDWCRQVVSGLLDNAIRHSPDQGRIAIVAACEEGRATLRIIDEGDGLEAEELESVFSRFVRGSRAESGLGFGIGLALAKWVVEQQSGSITLTSPAMSDFPGKRQGARRRGPGVEVTLRLPVAVTRQLAETGTD